MELLPNKNLRLSNRPLTCLRGAAPPCFAGRLTWSIRDGRPIHRGEPLSLRTHILIKKDAWRLNEAGRGAHLRAQVEGTGGCAWGMQGRMNGWKLRQVSSVLGRVLGTELWRQIA